MDFGIWYERYGAIIDFFVYLLLFGGLARVTLEKRFPGRGGQALTLALGLALALALAVAERTMGFNLGSLGPLALGIVLLLLGVLCHRLLRDRKSVV